jgi:hypothetical protein
LDTFIGAVFDVRVSLGVEITEAERFEQLDAALRSNPFYAWLKGAAVTPGILDEDSALAGAAADALDALHIQFRFFAGLAGELAVRAAAVARSCQDRCGATRPAPLDVGQLAIGAGVADRDLFVVQLPAFSFGD